MTLVVCVWSKVSVVGRNTKEENERETIKSAMGWWLRLHGDRGRNTNVQICIIIFEPWPGEYIFQEGNNERCKYLITKKTSSNLVPTIQRRTSSHKHKGLVLVKKGLVWKYHKCIVDMDIYTFRTLNGVPDSVYKCNEVIEEALYFKDLPHLLSLNLCQSIKLYGGSSFFGPQD